MSKFNSSLYFITDSTPYSEEEFLHRVEEALAGGATLLQLREKERTTREYLQLAARVHEIALKYQVPLIIDDRVDVALAVGAEGVHVGQSDLPVADARRLMGPDKIVGATTKTVPQALEAYEQGADYLGVGAIYVLEGIPIAGICVVSAIMKADDPRQAAQQLKARAMELKLCAKQ